MYIMCVCVCAHVQGGDVSNGALGSLLSSSQAAQPHMAGGPFLPPPDASTGMIGGLQVGVDLGATGGGAVGQPAPPSLVQVDPGVIVGLVNMHPDHTAGGTVQTVEGVRPAGGGGKKARLSQARAAWQQVGSVGPDGMVAGGMGVGGMGVGMMPAGVLGGNGDGTECEHKRPLRECEECAGKAGRVVWRVVCVLVSVCFPEAVARCRRACVQGTPAYQAW